MTTNATNLIASENIHGWSVIDPEGGRWWPAPEAEATIEASADPAATAIRICTEAPTQGAWSC